MNPDRLSAIKRRAGQASNRAKQDPLLALNRLADREFGQRAPRAPERQHNPVQINEIPSWMLTMARGYGYQGDSSDAALAYVLRLDRNWKNIGNA